MGLKGFVSPPKLTGSLWHEVVIACKANAPVNLFASGAPQQFLLLQTEHNYILWINTSKIY